MQLAFVADLTKANAQLALQRLVATVYCPRFNPKVDYKLKLKLNSLAHFGLWNLLLIRQEYHVLKCCSVSTFEGSCINMHALINKLIKIG